MFLIRMKTGMIVAWTGIISPAIRRKKRTFFAGKRSRAKA